MKKVLVLGSSGYIGSRLMFDYVNLYDVCGVDAGWFGDYNLTKSVQDFNDLSVDFIQKFDAVILLAGHSSVKMCERDLKSAYNNNVRNFLNLIEKINENQKLIYASSSSVYGMVGSNSVNEEYRHFIPHNDYDVTKHFIDTISQRSNVQYYGLRFGTVNGFSPKVRNDVMINSMVYSSIKSGEIKLYIKDITRPILGISDLSKAIRKIIENENWELKGLYNLASFSDTAENIAYGVSKVTGAPVVFYESDPTNIKNAKLETKCYDFDIDCSKFCKAFNFKFEETIETIAKSLVDNFTNIQFSNRSENKKYE